MAVVPKFISGNTHTDARGILRFFNEFDLAAVRRFYTSEHPSIEVIRAWQGHQKERKWFYVSDGEFKIVLVKLDNWHAPSNDLPYEEFILTADQNKILCIPPGFASGFKAVIPNSRLTIFSDFTLQESIADDFRFEKDLWYKW